MSAPANGRLEFEWDTRFLLLVAAIGVLACLRFGVDGGFGMTTAFFASVLLHEAGHMLLATAHHTPVKALGSSTRGVYLRRGKSQGLAEILISAAGRTVNLAIACSLIYTEGRIGWLAQMNLALFVLNMLPVKGSDGQRILAVLRERSMLATVPARR